MQIFPTIRKFFRLDVIEISSNNFKKIAQLEAKIKKLDEKKEAALLAGYECASSQG